MPSRLHKLLLFCLLFAICGIFPALAQFDGLLHKSYAERAPMLDSLYLKIRELPRIEDAENIANEIYQLGKEHKDRDLVLEKELIMAFYYAVRINKDHQQVIDKIETVIHQAQEQNNLQIELRATKLLSDFYWHGIKNYEMAFEIYLKLSLLLDKITYDAFPDMVEYYEKISKAYYMFRDYDTAIMFASKTIEIPETAYNWKFKWSCINTLGLCYRMGDYVRLSDYYFREAVKSKFFGTEDIRHSISMGNIGFNHYLRKEYDEAEPLLRADLHQALKDEDMGLAAGAAIPLADILLNKKQLDESWELIQQARQAIQLSGQIERYPELYTTLFHWYAEKGLFTEARSYLDSIEYATRDKEAKFNTLLLLRAQQRVDNQRIEAEREQALLWQKLARVYLIIALLVIVILIGVFTFWHYYVSKKHKEKHRAKELELENAKKELESFTARITEKNELIEQLKGMEYRGDNANVIFELTQKTILTEEDWNTFTKLFETVYPGYIHRLREKIQGITPAEIRMVVLSKLRFSHKDMANTLGITPQSSRVTWHRFRKKLDMEESYSLEELAESI